jgi:hypothetical protein
MPPQQPDRLLDFFDNALSLGAHDISVRRREAAMSFQDWM